MTTSDLIIIGGGVSGLGCARTLVENGFSDFQLITENIGGRVCTSADGQVNYGAYYVRSDYVYIPQFVKRTRKLRVRDVARWSQGRTRPLNRTILRHPLASFRLARKIYEFNRHYQKFKCRSLEVEQRQAIESDPYLNHVHQQTASDYLVEHRLECLRDGLINPIAWGSALVDVDEIPASTMLFLLLILIHPTFEFQFDFECLVQPFRKQIALDSVIRIVRPGGQWLVTTAEGRELVSKKIVVALPADRAAKLLGMDFQFNQRVDASMVHVKGKLRPPFEAAKYLVLAPELQDVILAKQADGSWIVYTRAQEIDLDRYFQRYDVIGQQTWRPAFRVGNRFTDVIQADDLYLVGDHNAVNMEDAFITGKFAAHKILGSA